jgi:hypothetical protein
MWNDVPGKIQFFRSHPNPYVVAPIGSVTDTNGKDIGFYMPLATGEALVRYFTNDYRKLVGFSNGDNILLAKHIHSIVQYVHSNGAIMVDANELGYMVTGTEPRVLDVDSWVIGGKLPPTVAVMPSIRDWHTAGFTKGSDWFAWAVVTFQLFTGIHPYKGTLAGYGPRDMELRMKERASVFSTGIRLNMSVRDFSCIPGPLLDWYRSTLHDGKREVPPSPTDTGISKGGYGVVSYTKVSTTGTLVLEQLLSTHSDAVKVFPCGVLLTSGGLLVDMGTGRVLTTGCTPGCEVVKGVGGWLVWTGSTYQYLTLSGSLDLPQKPVRGTSIISAGGRVLLVNGPRLTELVLTNLGNRQILSLGTSWDIMEYSTKWFEGFGVQDTLGATYLVLPHGDSACTQLRVPELDGTIPVAGTAGHRFVTVISMTKSGEYIKSELYLSEDYRSYKYWSTTTDSPDLNVAILPKGVCATIVRDGELTIFVPSNGNIKKLVDKQVLGMKLYRWDNRVVGILGGKVWAVSLK